MTRFTLLVADAEGRILGSNLPDGAEPTCHAVIGLSDGRGRATCREGCAAALVEGQQVLEPRHGHTNLGPARVQCTPVGGQILVAVVPTPLAAEEVVDLSPREREALALVAEGYTDVAIGEVLGVAVSTVRTLLTRVRRKLGAAGRAEAVARAIASGQL